VFDPGPEGSLGDVEWVLDARRRGVLPLLIVQGVLLTEIARAADFVLPGASYVEKEASYTNEHGRLQGTARAMAPPGTNPNIRAPLTFGASTGGTVNVASGVCAFSR
jgi:predicted molibdopterin-dependent oxidoreductase YjgC